MKEKIFVILFVLVVAQLFADAPVVSNVIASQRTDGSQIVDITYDVSDADNDTLYIEVLLSSDGGATFDISPDEANLSGDFGETVLPGTGKTITWNAGNETIDFDGDNFQLKITADDDPTPPVPDDLIFVQGGSFDMGDHYNEGNSDELPVHSVTLADFYIGEMEVTNQKVIDVYNWALGEGYINCTSSTVTNMQGASHELLDLDDDDCAISWNGSSLEFDASSHASSADCPCIEITWFGSVAYCNYKSLQEGLEACYDLSDWSCDWDADGYRLPTEAEWEYAARGGVNWTDDYRYSGCHNEGDLADYAWYNSNSSLQTHPVGTKLPNQLGIYDMSGNVWEWCNDWYDSSYYSSSSTNNPTGPSSGSHRILRGGSWNSDAHDCRVAYRVYSNPSSSNFSHGFRILRALP